MVARSGNLFPASYYLPRWAAKPATAHGRRRCFRSSFATCLLYLQIGNDVLRGYACRTEVNPSALIATRLPSSRQFGFKVLGKREGKLASGDVVVPDFRHHPAGCRRDAVFQ